MSLSVQFRAFKSVSGGARICGEFRQELTHKVDGAVDSRITVLAIHVVCATARVVFDPDTVVFHVSVVLLSDLQL